MGINFPNAPTTNQLYPQPPVAGLPVYRWDGAKWTTQGATAAKTPVYTDGSTAMTAPLTLVAPPVNPTDAAAKSYVDGAVRFDAAQSLAAAQQAQARQNVYAAPFDALAYNGMQANGSIEVSQINGGASVPLGSGGGPYIVDSWVAGYINASAVMASQQLPAASFPASLPGYNAALSLKATTAMSALANGDYALLRTIIEGRRVARLAWGTSGAQPLSYGFWFYVPVSGVISTRIFNAASNRFYYSEHTVSAGWNWCTATIPGDTIGTWNKDYTTGMYFDIFVAGKSATLTVPGSWTATGTLQTTNSTNFLSTSGNQCLLTGFILLPGISLPAAARAPLIMRPYDQELLLCKRYYRRLAGTAIRAVCLSATAISIQGGLDIEMNYSPTQTLLKTSWVAANFEVIAGTVWAAASAATLTGTTSTQNSFQSSIGGFSGLPTPNFAWINTQVDVLALDAHPT